MNASQVKGENEKRMVPQTFNQWVEPLISTLRGMAVRAGGFSSTYEDHDDFFQEMLAHLWAMWRRGEAAGKTRSYLLQSCWFALQNHLRVTKDPQPMSSLDATSDQSEEEGVALGESPAFCECSQADETHRLDARLVVHGMLNNGLTVREKDVIRGLLQGFTTRELGQQLGVSHVRVIALTQSIRAKWGAKL